MRKEPLSIRLVKAMQQKGVSQAELADRLGMPRGTMSMYMSGKRNPKREAIFKIAHELGVTEAWLMGYDDESDLEDGLARISSIFSMLSSESRIRLEAYAKALADVEESRA